MRESFKLLSTQFFARRGIAIPAYGSIVYSKHPRIKLYSLILETLRAKKGLRSSSAEDGLQEAPYSARIACLVVWKYLPHKQPSIFIATFDALMPRAFWAVGRCRAAEPISVIGKIKHDRQGAA
ncbi:hypothetical protein [Rhodopseudomonas sp. BR0M22]|uniref:hypothetical protein n=1 Tax=Rhodopseudomonas sp. BR0M22 TaxID=2269369 RepID=UPI0013DF0B18|nr:hypothetical protein [Rhodopseudomonas sp. BR0M22]